MRRVYFIIAALLFTVMNAVTINISLANDEQPSDVQPKKSTKYSKFFDEKIHWCDALVINCSDFRFTSATQEFINNRLGLKNNYDFIAIPGSIHNLMDSKTRDLVLKTFGVSVRLHHVKRVVIIAHQDCTGYGGSKSYNEPVDEYKTVSKELKKARRLFGFKFPHLKVYLYYGTVLNKDHQRIYNYKQIL